MLFRNIELKMAFEDRSSPNTATGPNTEISQNSPNSPESTRTSPFTCTTIQKPQTYISPPTSPAMHPYIIPKLEQERSFLRITSYALSSPKHEKDDDSSQRSYSPNAMMGNYSHSEASTSPPPNDEPTIQTLKYSITNILQPDFGKSALMRTKTSPKISFKPYEERKGFATATAPLGSLCQTVSQIGKVNRTPEPIPPPREPSPAKSIPDEGKSEDGKVPTLWPAWVYCTRYSDRPSSGPRSRRMKKPTPSGPKPPAEDKRPRTAFSGAQLARLKHEFAENRYLTERRRQQLSGELGLNEAQIKIWFQNKRAKIKKASGQKNPLALQLMAQGLYNHSTVACDEDELGMSMSMSMPMPT